MPRKSKLKPTAKPSKSRLGSIGYLDDEHLNWLHSKRTPEEKKRDAEMAEYFRELLERRKSRDVKA
jgi:hypothetical protein